MYKTLVFIDAARNRHLRLSLATFFGGLIEMLLPFLSDNYLSVHYLSVNAGQRQRVRKGKRAKKPMPRWVRKTLVFCGVVIKISVVLLVLYLCWLIYKVIYEEFFLTFLPVTEPFVFG